MRYEQARTKIHGWIVGLLATAVILTSVCAGTMGLVVSVADGDTITVLTAEKQQVKVRLAAIDAPEGGQEFAQKSKEALAALVAGKSVTIREDGKDRYGRIIGWVEADGTNANREMVRAGWAWHFIQYNKDPEMARLQEEARQAQRGLWAAPNPPIAPWEFRALRRGGNSEKPTPDADQSEAGSGRFWINSNGVRHNRGCRWFGKTKRGRYSAEAEGKACGICGG